MKKIGVTGNIGAGKSEVCRIFGLLGLPVYGADERAKSLMVSDWELAGQIKALLGPESYNTEGQIDRAYIAQRVFGHPEMLRALNALVHPAVGRDFQHWCLEQQAPDVIKEAALLFESGSYRELDRVILVRADEATRLVRVKYRDKSDEKEIKKRMESQMSQLEKEKLTDWFIDNNGFEPLVLQVLHMHRRILALG